MIKVFTSKNCKPCHEVTRIIQEHEPDGVVLIDIETDEGFEIFKKDVLGHGDAEVPSAYKDGRRCNILIDEGENIIFDCPDEASSSQ